MGVASPNKTDMVEKMLGHIEHRGPAGKKCIEAPGVTLGVAWTKPPGKDSIASKPYQMVADLAGGSRKAQAIFDHNAKKSNSGRGRASASSLPDTPRSGSVTTIFAPNANAAMAYACAPRKSCSTIASFQNTLASRKTCLGWAGPRKRRSTSPAPMLPGVAVGGCAARQG